MPGENLTRVEAIERASVVSTESYAVHLDLTTSDTTFRSRTTVTFGASAGASTFIDAITSAVHSVTLNGVDLDPATVSDGIRIQLDDLATENVLVVDADMFYVNTGEGLHRFVDPVDSKVYLYSQFEVPDSRRVFAAFEQPDLKATFDFEVVVPTDWVVVSNSPTPSPVVDGASATWTFPQTPRISSYITAIVAGPYVAQHDQLTSSDGRTIPLGIYVRQSLAEFLDFDYIFDITKKGFEYFEREFAVPYPFEKYDQLFVPEFNAGAMENAGCVTFTEVYVFRSKVTDAVRERRVVTILHELAHMWFGDLEDVQINIDGITYAKGGSVLKQLVAYVGREAFFTGVTNYFRANAWKNAELADLLRELEKTSKRDLTMWSAKWLETAGVNTLTPEIVTDDDGIITSFDIVQTAIADYPTIRPHRLAVGIYAFQGSDLVRTNRIELDIDGERTTVTDLIGQHRGALVLVNDDDLAYAKIRLDGESLAMAIDHLSDISDPLARALVWGSAWDSTRDAEMAPSDFVDLVLGNIATESESTTVRTTLAQLATTARMYVSPDRRENTIRRVADAMLELAENAEPGSDQQFQFLRTFASMADTAEHASVLRSIRSGERVISGITIDTDLSWDLLEGMVLAGGADESEIAAALAADNTSNGQQAAARLRATIPTAEAKRKILETMRDDATIANSQCDHYVRGYTHVNDPSVFENLVSEYFDAVQTVWDSRTFKIAEYFAIGMYPTVMATESLGSMTRAWLDSNTNAPSALRRIVIEGLATVDRALAAQRRDAEVNR